MTKNNKKPTRKLDKSKLNGSVDLLAKALGNVVLEAVEVGNAPINRRLDNMESDMRFIKGEIGYINKNISSMDSRIRKIERRK